MSFILRALNSQPSVAQPPGVTSGRLDLEKRLADIGKLESS
jgi:hypothetical protein